MLKCRLMADNAMDYFGVMTDGDTARAWGQIIGTMQHMFGMLHADTAMESLLADDGAAQDHMSELSWMRADPPRRRVGPQPPAAADPVPPALGRRHGRRAAGREHPVQAAVDPAHGVRGPVHRLRRPARTALVGGAVAPIPRLLSDGAGVSRVALDPHLRVGAAGRAGHRTERQRGPQAGVRRQHHPHLHQGRVRQGQLLRRVVGPDQGRPRRRERRPVPQRSAGQRAARHGSVLLALLVRQRRVRRRGGRLPRLLRRHGRAGRLPIGDRCVYHDFDHWLP